MKALILAAGKGTRLKPYTDSLPKAMVKVSGKPILFKQLDNLIENGIRDITIVVGYCAEVIIQHIKELYPFVKIIVNEQYEKTNNMYSAYLAKEEIINSDFLLMNADVFFDSTVIEELLKDIYKNAIVTEQGIYNDENMKIKTANNRIIGISKNIAKEEAFGVSIDIYKFTKAASVYFFKNVTDYIEKKKIVDQWTEVAINDVLKEEEFFPCPLIGRWMEIDNYSDLLKAESIFK